MSVCVFSPHSLRAYYVPGTLLSVGNPAVNQTDTGSAHKEFVAEIKPVDQ